jgi:hypothetical protein
MIILVTALLVYTVSTGFLVWAAFLSCMLVFVFPCFLLGTVTPSLVKYTVNSLDNSGSTVGRLNAFNTIGSIIGTFVPTFLSIPACGTGVTFLIFSGILLILGLTYFISCRRRTVRCIVCTVLFIGCCLGGNVLGFPVYHQHGTEIEGMQDRTAQGSQVFRHIFIDLLCFRIVDHVEVPGAVHQEHVEIMTAVVGFVTDEFALANHVSHIVFILEEIAVQGNNGILGKGDALDTAGGAFLHGILGHGGTKLGHVPDAHTDDPGIILYLLSLMVSGDQLMGKGALLKGDPDGRILIGSGGVFPVGAVKNPAGGIHGTAAQGDIQREGGDGGNCFFRRFRFRGVGAGERKEEGNGHQRDKNPAQHGAVHGASSFHSSLRYKVLYKKPT